MFKKSYVLLNNKKKDLNGNNIQFSQSLHTVTFLNTVNLVLKLIYNYCSTLNIYIKFRVLLANYNVYSEYFVCKELFNKFVG